MPCPEGGGVGLETIGKFIVTFLKGIVFCVGVGYSENKLNVESVSFDSKKWRRYFHEQPVHIVV